MTITLELAPDAEALLQDEAAQTGRDTETVAAALLSRVLMEQAQVRKSVLAGIRRGLDDGVSGRVVALDEWDAKMRTKYAISAETEPLSQDELNALP